MARFNRITIIGLGLIGGSLGMAIRRKHLAREVIGWSRRASTLAQAKRLGAIDRGAVSLAEAVREADVVVLTTPVDAIVPMARRLATFMKAGSILTDVGSTKNAIVCALESCLPSRVTFVGAHPLAGSEQRGIAAAHPRLFDGSLCLVTATRRTPPQAVRAITRLWKPLVRRVIVMDPTMHDRLLAAVSHVPHLVAFSLIAATERNGLRIMPPSFLDATRVAKSDPELWDDILLSNRAEILSAMDRFETSWRQFRAALTRADRRALVRLLRRANTLRHRLDH